MIASKTPDCRLALFMHNDNDYQLLLRDDCVETAKRFGFSVRFFCADSDEIKQIEQIQGCLREPKSQRPTVLMVVPVLEARLLSVAYAAARLGIGWVLLGRKNTYMPGLREEFPHLPIFSVAADHKECGRIQGRQFKAMLPKGGELVYIRGPLGTSSAIMRFEGVQEILQDGSIAVSALSSDWTTDGGDHAMKDWMQAFQRRQCPRFVVGAQNDAMAIGARKAVLNAKREQSGFSVDQIQFTGCDGTPQFGRRLVANGTLKATVIMPSTAGRAITEVATMLEGRPRPDAEIVLSPSSFPELETLKLQKSA